jgi:hypothetical protein
MKKMYNQPQTDVAAFETEHLMQGITLSPGAGEGGGGGVAGAPAARGGEIID